MVTDSAAIMFSDVSGSSRLFKEVGDLQARAIISRVVSMMMDKTLAQQGTVIKTIGDEVMASFPTAKQAADAAIAIQNDIDTHNYGAKLTIRIGFHFGAVIHEKGDIYGEAVNDAADLVKVAKGGQIIISQQTLIQLPPNLRERCSRFDEIRLKGGKEKAVIYLVRWQASEQASNATMFMAAIDTSVINQASEIGSIQLEYLGRSFRLTKDEMPYSIGRDPGASLTVDFPLASREHCTIDYRRGKFVLTDKSTNGTYITPEGRTRLYIRREETPLAYKGIISFSTDDQVEGPHRIHYSCQG